MMNVLVRAAGRRCAPRCRRVVIPSAQRHASVVTAVKASSHGVKPAPYGQPHFVSHPHLVPSHDLTPGFPLSEYHERRARLIQRLPERSFILSVGGSIKYMTHEIFYKFRQSSDFWYLTGLQEPDSAMILEKTSDARGYRMTLFVNPKDPKEELWNGARLGVDAAVKHFGADDARDIKHLKSHLKSLLKSHNYAYMDLPQPGTKQSLLKCLNSSGSEQDYLSGLRTLPASLVGAKVRPLKDEIWRLRAIKSDAEVGALRKAAEISAIAHAKTMRFTRPNQGESDLAAHFEYLCALRGAQRPAYVPVVASGPNALVIHYTANDQIMKGDELVLMDAGCETNGYSSDISRTWPVSGSFSSAQRDLYSAVLATNKAIIPLCTESSNQTLHSLHRQSCVILSRELRQIGFDLDYAGSKLDKLYPHFFGHHIGLDLHEPGIDRHPKLATGMVITVEPGVYVPPTPTFPKHFHNMGIRIEDEVLIQKDHAVVLSINAPKEIVDVEGACQGVLGLEAY